MKKIIGICGSASEYSSNLAILNFIAEKTKGQLEFEIVKPLSAFPQFKTALTSTNVPEEITSLRQKIADADGIIISSPEYVFSIPSGLKNIIEWCVSTTVFSGKITGLITASANGEKGHEEMQMIMKTLEVLTFDKISLLIQGVKGKMDSHGFVKDEKTLTLLESFIKSYVDEVKKVR